MFSKEKMWSKYNKRVKRDLPVYDMPRPPGQFHESSCLIFPLYMAYEGIIPRYVINSAFWAAHAWRVNTDMLDKQWDIYFYVDDALWVPDVQEMFERANLTDFVRLFKVKKGRAIRHKMGSGLYATLDPFFYSYDRCYMVDTDMFPSIRDPKNRIKTDVLRNIGEDESLFMTHNYNYDPNGLREIAKQKYEIETEPEAREIYNKYVAAYLGHPPTGRWSVSGQLFAWNPQKLREDFKEMVIQLTPDVSDDEEQYGFYLEKHGLEPAKLRHLWDIPIHFRRKGYFGTEPHYFDHIWLEPDWEVFGQKSKTGEVDAVPGYADPEILPIWTENIGINRRL